MYFLFDLGNTVIKLAYERVIENICRDSNVNRDQLLDVFELPNGYRDMERGAATFLDFYELICDRAGYRGTMRDFHGIWSDFFDGPIPGIEEVLQKVRAQHRVAFLSNSNEVHAELIPRRYTTLFEKQEHLIFSHRHRVAKPDPEMFKRALDIIGSKAEETVLIDDLIENVLGARSIGMKAFQFHDSKSLLIELEREDLLPATDR
jgi:FMN phosphatase YigB (HAD superfamily)